jgi:restriction system protein
MSALDAAANVLGAAGTPLRVDEITARMLAEGLWSSAGKTPTATVHAQLASDIKRRGNESRFVRTAPGTFGLRSWPVQELAAIKKPSAMSFTDAAETVLGGSTPHEPMHYKAITQEAIDQGLLSTKGLTPEQTMYVQLYSEIDRREKRGDAQRFVRHPKGFFGLAQWQAGGLQFEIAAHNRKVKEELRASLLAIPPKSFEALVGHLLTAVGFEDVTVTAYHGDGGVDVRGTLVVGDVIRTQMAVQVKRWKNRVQAPTVQQVRGSLGAHDQGLIITTSDFSAGARQEAARADRTPVALMSGDELVALLVEHQIGVRRAPHDLLELQEEPELSPDDAALEP